MKLKSRFFALVICALAIGFFATSARADVTYTFNGVNNGLGGDGATVGFQYATTSFVTSFTELTTSQLSACTFCLVSSNPDVFLAPITFLGDGVAFVDGYNDVSVFLFGSNAFVTPGTYFSSSPFSTGQLVVSNVSVPEPGSLLLFLTGGTFLGLMIWRKKSDISFSGQYAA